MLTGYQGEAARRSPGFQASGQRGAAFFARQFNVSEKMSACSACHTENPGQGGRHVVTGKAIQPLAPAANAERLTDPAKGGEVVPPQLQGSGGPGKCPGGKGRLHRLPDRVTLT